ncbi:MAG: hypothetical protein WCI80_05875 [Bacteroidota bacterium]
MFKSQTLENLSEQETYSKRSIQKKLDTVSIRPIELDPVELVLTADVTFWGREYGVIVFRSQYLKKNIYWKEVNKETPQEYLEGRRYIESQGYKIQAVVLDGKKGVKEVFKDVPVQLCQFHQMKTVTRYLTRKPELEASKQLRNIMMKLTISTEKDFVIKLNDWYIEWGDFIIQKTKNEETGRWFYTHSRLRSAYMSLRNNIGYLFTFERYPEYRIPNTTNSLDGMFSHLKKRINIHRGLRQDRRYKLIQAYLIGRSSV